MESQRRSRHGSITVFDDPNIVLNLRRFNIVAKVWAYIKKYSHNTTARKFQLEHEVTILQQD